MSLRLKDAPLGAIRIFTFLLKKGEIILPIKPALGGCRCKTSNSIPFNFFRKYFDVLKSLMKMSLPMYDLSTS